MGPDRGSCRGSGVSLRLRKRQLCLGLAELHELDYTLSDVALLATVIVPAAGRHVADGVVLQNACLAQQIKNWLEQIVTVPGRGELLATVDVHDDVDALEAPWRFSVAVILRCPLSLD